MTNNYEDAFECRSDLEKIYAEFGSQVSWPGAVRAIQDRCGFEISNDEIERIASRAATAAEFETIWENEDWWTDENNGTLTDEV